MGSFGADHPQLCHYPLCSLAYVSLDTVDQVTAGNFGSEVR